MVIDVTAEKYYSVVCFSKKKEIEISHHYIEEE